MLQEITAKQKSSTVGSAKLVALTATGPVYRRRRQAEAITISSALALLQELAARAEDPRATVISSLASRLEGNDAYEAWLSIASPLTRGLVNLPVPSRVAFLSEVLRYLRPRSDANGVESILASALNSAWPFLSPDLAEHAIKMSRRHIERSRFADSHSVIVSDATTRTVHFVPPGALKSADVDLWIDEWRLMHGKDISFGRNAEGALGQFGYGSPLGKAGGAGGWASGMGAMGGGAPGAMGGALGAAGPEGALGQFGYGSSPLGKAGGAGGWASGMGDMGGGSPGAMGGAPGAAGPEGALGQFGYGSSPLGKAGGAGGWASGMGAMGGGTPGAMGRAYGSDPLGSAAGGMFADLGGGVAGAFGIQQPGASGGPYGFNAGLGFEGAAMGPEAKAKTALWLTAVGMPMVVFGLGLTLTTAPTGIGPVIGVTVASAGAFAVGYAGALAYLAGTEADERAAADPRPIPVIIVEAPARPEHQTPKPAEPPPADEPDPKEPRPGDSYPDPDGGGGVPDPTMLPDDDWGGPIDPTMLPHDEFGGGNPLWLPAGDDSEPLPDPAMLWGRFGGNHQAATVGTAVEVERLWGPGLSSQIVQVGPRSFRV